MKHIKSVLIVDDNHDDCYLAARALEKSGGFDHIWSLTDPLQVLDAYDDEAASRAARPGEFPPTVIILDINMPEMTGFELIDALAARTLADGGVRPVVICMLTSSDHELDVERAEQHPQVRSYYPKPLTQEHIAELLSAFGTERP